MFDFTKEIKIDKKDYTLYRKIQIMLYSGTFLLSIYLAYLIIFPHQYFTFSFSNSSSLKNTVFDPRLPDNSFPENGKTKGNILFNTNLLGDYSKANINLIINKKSYDFESPMISARKSYQAFFYNDGDPIGFKDGSLLKNKNNYFIISEGKLRKFSNLNFLNSLGYSQNNFQEVSENDLLYNPTGEDINENNPYPNFTFFRIDDNYYVLENQKLKKFVSDQAFLSSYNQFQVIEKNVAFLNNYPLLEDLAGFANGTLISNDTSVFVTVNDQILPIADVPTFESKGYNWQDVISVGSDEIALYKKGGLFTINSPHPDGSIFKTDSDSKYYLIKDTKKHLLPTENIAQSWLKKNPVIVSKKSLEIKADCQPQKNIFNSNSYSCDIPLDAFENIIGTSFEFNLNSNSDIELDFINVDFKKNVNAKNFKEFFSEIVGKIKQNYVQN